MNESEKLDRIFEDRKWRGKYFVSWCELCNVVRIECPDCKNGSCSGGGCDKCIKDFIEFCRDVKHSVCKYLNEEERKVYDKALSLKKHILDSIRDGETEINFQARKEAGKFSLNEEELFGL